VCSYHCPVHCSWACCGTPRRVEIRGVWMQDFDEQGNTRQKHCCAMDAYSLPSPWMTVTNTAADSSPVNNNTHAGMALLAVLVLKHSVTLHSPAKHTNTCMPVRPIWPNH
jgi:hypothetical protein